MRTRCAPRLVLAALLCLGLAAVPWAAAAQSVPQSQANSSNYGVNEVHFGPGGQLNAASGNYGADQSAGDTAAGNAKGNTYRATAGSQTRRNESLEFIVNSSGSDLGVLSTTSAKVATATFTVKSYLSSGYVVMNASDPPSTGGSNSHSFAATTSNFTSNPGTEQFGINLVRNSTTCSPPSATNFGSDPVQDYPDTPPVPFGYGVAATNYNLCGLFKYNKGDVVARAASSSGITQYTVSYLFNISSLTPSGTYIFPHVLVATATF